MSSAKTAAGQDDYSMNHSAVLYLMTPAGSLATSFRWDETEADIADGIRDYISD